MRKYSHVLGNDLQPGRRRGRSSRLVAWALLLLAAPFVYEEGLLVYSRWQDMLGTHVEVKTPLLDLATRAWEEAQGEAGSVFRGRIQNGSWSPVTAVPAVVAVAAFGSLFLRRG